MRRRTASVVIPVRDEHASLITGGLTSAITEVGAGGYPLAILRNGVQPRAAADAIEEILKNARLPAWIIVGPLRAPEHQIDLGRRLHADGAGRTVAGPSVVVEVTPGGGGQWCAAGLPLSFYGRMNHRWRLALFEVPHTSRVAIVVHRLARRLSLDQ